MKIQLLKQLLKYSEQILHGTVYCKTQLTINSSGLSAFENINTQIKVKIHLFPLSNTIKEQRSKPSQIQLILRIKISKLTIRNKSFLQVALKSTIN